MTDATTPRGAGPGPGRVPGIDALRGLSIVLVVWHHLGLRVPLPESWPQPLREAMTMMGFESVFVFFAISGFLITSHSLARWGALRAIDARAFYVRRARRILPLLAVLVAVLAALHLAHADHYVIDRAGQSLPAAVAAAAVFRINMYESVTGYLPASWDVLWSLSVEELFYLAFPLACLTLGRTRWGVPALLVLAVSLPWSRGAMRGHGLWYEKADLPGLSAIACGVLAALAVRRWPRVPRALSTALAGAGTLVIAVVFLEEGTVWHVLHNGTLLVLAVSAAAMCAAFAWGASGQGADGRFVSFPMKLLAPLRSCGRLSYEIYLTHMFVVWGVVDGFARAGTPEAAVSLVYAVTLVVAWASGALVDRGARGVRSCLLPPGTGAKGKT